MPYKTTSELPDSVKDTLPEHAKEIFMAAFNNAYDEYRDAGDRQSNDSREETAFKVAWSAVKQKYEKSAQGKWVSKDE